MVEEAGREAIWSWLAEPPPAVATMIAAGLIGDHEQYEAWRARAKRDPAAVVWWLEHAAEWLRRAPWGLDLTDE